MLTAVCVLAAASVPGASRAGLRPRTVRADRARTQSPARLITVGVGATGGDDRAREMLTATMSLWITQQPQLRLHARGSESPSLTLTANVRALTVQHDSIGSLARCDIGMVVSDSRGAVRGMLDARRTIRSSGPFASDDALAQSALRSAVDGALRGLVAEMVPQLIR